MLKKEKIQMAGFIRKMRKNCGLTQSQLGQLMGTSQGRVSQVECSKEVELNEYLKAIETLITSSQNKRILSFRGLRAI